MSTDLTALSTERQNHLTILLSALAFFLSTVEFLLPRPLPFWRLGLANIPLLLALDLLDARRYGILLLVKVLGMNVLSGGLFSYTALFSLGGSLASGLVMQVLSILLGRHISMIGLSTAGALASNAIQLLLARVLVFGSGAVYMLPLVLGLGTTSGVLLGFATNYFAERSLWLRGLRGQVADGAPASTGQTDRLQAGTSDTGRTNPPTAAAETAFRAPRQERWWSSADRRREWWQRRLPARPLLLGGSLLILLLTLLPGYLPTLVIGSLSLILTWLSGRRIRILNSLLFSSGIILAHLLVPSGKILASFGPFLIGQESLLAGIRKAIIFQAILLISRCTIRPDLRLPGKIGQFFPRAMQYYESLLAASGSIRPRTLFRDLDRLLCQTLR